MKLQCGRAMRILLPRASAENLFVQLFLRGARTRPANCRGGRAPRGVDCAGARIRAGIFRCTPRDAAAACGVPCSCSTGARPIAEAGAMEWRLRTRSAWHGCRAPSPPDSAAARAERRRQAASEASATPHPAPRSGRRKPRQRQICGGSARSPATHGAIFAPAARRTTRRSAFFAAGAFCRRRKCGRSRNRYRVGRHGTADHGCGAARRDAGCGEEPPYCACERARGAARRISRTPYAHDGEPRRFLIASARWRSGARERPRGAPRGARAFTGARVRVGVCDCGRGRAQRRCAWNQ